MVEGTCVMQQREKFTLSSLMLVEPLLYTVWQQPDDHVLRLDWRTWVGVLHLVRCIHTVECSRLAPEMSFRLPVSRGRCDSLLEQYLGLERTMYTR